MQRKEKKLVFAGPTGSVRNKQLARPINYIHKKG
jgi:hypothetical protein